MVNTLNMRSYKPLSHPLSKMSIYLLDIPVNNHVTLRAHNE